jgi:hypothetical protein
MFEETEYVSTDLNDAQCTHLSKYVQFLCFVHQLKLI